MADRAYFFCGCDGAPLAYAPTLWQDLADIAVQHHKEDCGRGKRRFWERSLHRYTDEEIDRNLACHWESDPVSYLKLRQACLKFPWANSYFDSGDLARWGVWGERWTHLLTIKKRINWNGESVLSEYRIRFRRNHSLVKQGLFSDDDRVFPTFQEAKTAARLLVEGELQGPCPRHGGALTVKRLATEWDNDPWWRFHCDCLTVEMTNEAQRRAGRLPNGGTPTMKEVV